MYLRMNQPRTRQLIVTGLLGLLALAAFVIAPTKANAMAAEQNTLAMTESIQENTVTVAAGDLSTVEIDDLTFMREEEKLAHDVYLSLYNEWGLPIFKNIAASEQRHTDSIKTLLDRYGLADPITGNDAGEFSNPDLQALYDQLIVEGTNSVDDALRVGAAIEEIDILDLLEALYHTDKADIIRVYENLLSGSENHLRAFVSTLERQSGEIYVPQYLSQEAFDTIISASSGNGRNGGGYGGGGANGKGGNGSKAGWKNGKGWNG